MKFQYSLITGLLSMFYIFFGPISPFFFRVSREFPSKRQMVKWYFNRQNFRIEKKRILHQIYNRFVIIKRKNKIREILSHNCLEKSHHFYRINVLLVSVITSNTTNYTTLLVPQNEHYTNAIWSVAQGLFIDNTIFPSFEKEHSHIFSKDFHTLDVPNNLPTSFYANFSTISCVSYSECRVFSAP